MFEWYAFFFSFFYTVKCSQLLSTTGDTKEYGAHFTTLLQGHNKKLFDVIHVGINIYSQGALSTFKGTYCTLLLTSSYSNYTKTRAPASYVAVNLFKPLTHSRRAEGNHGFKNPLGLDSKELLPRTWSLMEGDALTESETLAAWPLKPPFITYCSLSLTGMKHYLIYSYHF